MPDDSHVSRTDAEVDGVKQKILANKCATRRLAKTVDCILLLLLVI